MTTSTPPTSPAQKTAVVTGASSGIGEATARALAQASFHVVLGARRRERLEQIAESINGTALALDVTQEESVDAFAAAVGQCDVLVNNAGGALGADPIAEANLDDWRWMYETNVLGTLRMTKALLPALVASGDGLVVNIGSIAAREAYIGGGGYNVAKFGIAAMTRSLRLELLGTPVRVTEIDPGMVETDFSLVRFKGDAARADAVYQDTTPLQAQDIADAVTWVATRPPRMNVDSMLILARDQTSAQVVNRHA